MREQYPIEFRVEGHPDKADGRYIIPHPTIKDYVFHVMFSTGEGWEHLSVTLRKIIVKSKGVTKLVERTCTWAEMCMLKDAFWAPDECTVQFHPPKVNNISNHDFCLHIWKATDAEFGPVPPTILVGAVKINELLTAMHKVKPDLTREELADAIFVYANKVNMSEFPTDQEGIKKLTNDIFPSL